MLPTTLRILTVPFRQSEQVHFLRGIRQQRHCAQFSERITHLRALPCFGDIANFVHFGTHVTLVRGKRCYGHNGHKDDCFPKA